MNKMAAFGEQEAPYAAVFGDVSKSIDAGVGVSCPFGERRHDRRALAYRASQRRVRAVGRTAGRVRGCAHRSAGGRPNATVRTRLLAAERAAPAIVLPLLPTRSYPPDAAWQDSAPIPSACEWRTLRCPRRPTCGCCWSGTRAPASSARPRRCEGYQQRGLRFDAPLSSGVKWRAES